MRNLISFLIKYNYWFLFLLLEVTSFVLLFRFNHYQQSLYFTTANAAVGFVYEKGSAMKAYFNLRSINEDLMDRDLMLEQQLVAMQNRLQQLEVDTANLQSLERVAQQGVRLYPAQVINNCLTMEDNYITLDKGSADGIRPEMGVVDARGVVGIVYKTSAHYALVISLLNSKSSISCKVVGSDYFGYLKWQGRDVQYAYLKDLPRHAEFNLGDTVVTSGYSSIFPEGIMVGTVDDIQDSHDGLSYLLKIKLATDMGQVQAVRVVERIGQVEQMALEKQK